VSPKWRRRAALVLVVVCLIAWPATACTVARGEPPFILGLSWLAIVISALDVAVSSDVRAEQEGERSD
jgi:hypothetical protein